MRHSCVLTRPGMVWQAFVPDTVLGQLAVFDIAEINQENGIVAMASVCQTNNTLTNVQVVTFLLFPKPKIKLEDCKALIKVWSTP